MIRKSNRAITLIALVITIVVMLILATVAINLTLGENGIFRRAKMAATMNKKAQYMEEINLAIADEQLERTQTQKDEPYIVSLKNKIEKKEWVKEVLMCDENSTEQQDASKNTVLIIVTKDGYEMLVDVDNKKSTASVKTESFSKTGENLEITYDPNTGTGHMEVQSVRKGFSATLKNNEFTKQNYSFAGWSKNINSTYEDEEIYAAGSKIQIQEDTTLYAVWRQEVVNITYNANNENTTETMEPTPVGKGNSIQISDNLFTREGHSFVGWNTKTDGSGTSYENGDTLENLNEDITLYAMWQINQYTATFYSNLLSNGYFTNGTTGWTNPNHNTTAVDTNVKCGNNNSLRISNSYNERGITKTTYNINYKPSTSYKISIKAYKDSNSSYGDYTRYLMVYIPEYNKNGNFLSYNHYISFGIDMADKTWISRTYTFTTRSDGYRFNPFTLDFLDLNKKTTVWVADIKVEEVQTKTLDYGSPLGTLPTTTRTGYTSGGYYTGEDGTGTQVNASTLLLQDTEYYEKWNSN